MMPKVEEMDTEAISFHEKCVFSRTFYTSSHKMIPRERKRQTPLKAFKEDFTMNNCLGNVFGGDNNCCWIIIIALIVLCCCCN